MIVVKFSGSSTANAENLKRAAKIINSETSYRYVVISSPGKNLPDDIKITDMLYILHSKFQSREGYNEMLKKIAEQFMKIILELGINFDIDREISILKQDLLAGESADYIASRGEFITAKIFAKILNWEFVDAAKIIFFDADGKLDEAKTFETASEVLKSYEHAVIPGFYGSIGGMNIKLFPRGGADITGAILARALNADFLEKWSETSQIFSADPSIVENPEIIRNITYQELRELTYMGINVIDEDVIFLLQHVGIPLFIKNIHYPDDVGTFVSEELPEGTKREVAACIAGLRHYKAVKIEKFGLNKAHGIGEKVWGIFARRNIPCEHYISGIYNFSIILKNPMFDLKRNEIFEEIRKAINPENISVESELSLIAIIGKGMGTVKGLFARAFNAIAGVDVKVRMINQGSDDLNIIIGVDDKDFEKTVKALYNAMILS